ncbi:hypothetical protein MMC10_010829 [Thelotrema lepadinum]|nr:hypothetical protein [Thelotrema lepadinum]
MCGQSSQQKLDDPEELDWCRLVIYTMGARYEFREIRPYPVAKILDQGRRGNNPVARMPKMCTIKRNECLKKDDLN